VQSRGRPAEIRAFSQIGEFYYNQDTKGSEADLLADYRIPNFLESLQSLTDLSWEVRIPMPVDIFKVLTTKWPNARVHVRNVDRNEWSRSGPEHYIPMDTKLLSLPQLCTLD